MAEQETRRVAVVSGAGSGIGRAVALGLASAGLDVALAGRRADALEETAALIGGDVCLPVPTDVTEESAVATLFDRTVARFGRVDVLFNNAGVSSFAAPFDEIQLAGNAASAMTAGMADGMLQADGSSRPEPTMDVQSVVRAVVLMATMPEDAAVFDLTVAAPDMPFVGRG